MNSTAHYVNDIVHSFCYVCRNPGTDWPLLICGQMAHAPFEARMYKMTARYELFIQYALRQPMKFSRFCSTMVRLEMYTNQWQDPQFGLANWLLMKHYNCGRTLV